MKLLNKIITCTLLIGTIMSAGKEMYDKKFDVKNNGKLDINLMSGDITINTWNKAEVVVRAGENDDDDAFKITQRGNTIYIENDFRNYGGDEDLIVTIPSDFNVDCNSNNGNVTIKNKLNGSLKVKTMSGDIRLNDVYGYTDLYTSGGDIQVKNLTGDVKLSTMGGDIRTGTINGQRIKISTSGGDISISELEGNSNIKTMGGFIKILKCKGKADTETMGGDIAASNIEGDFSGDTKGGNIDISSCTGDLNLTTMGGDIEVRKSSGSIDAKTHSGYIYAEMNLKNGNGRSRLESMMGDIKLLIPESASADIEAIVENSGSWKRHSRDDDDENNIISDYPSYYSKNDKYSSRNEKRIKINSGTEKIRIKAINSTIKIQKNNR